MLLHISAALGIVLILYSSASANPPEDGDKSDKAQAAEGPNFSLFYNFDIKSIHGTPVDFKEFMGKVILVVNVASECGFTDGHYKGLQALHQLLSISEKFSVVAFPCNQFKNQEPKSNKEIYEFAKKNYGVTFPIFEKVDVTGETAHDFWKLIEATTGQAPNWNFWKYLVDYQGNVINFWGPWTTVEEITKEVKEAVDQAVKESARKRQSTEAAGMPATKEQVQPDSMSRAPPVPLHRAKRSPSPDIPSGQNGDIGPQPPPPPSRPAGPPKPPATKPNKKKNEL